MLRPPKHRWRYCLLKMKAPGMGNQHTDAERKVIFLSAVSYFGKG